MTPAAIRFMQGDNSIEVLDEMRAEFLRFAAQTGDKSLPLQCMLGLGRPRVVRIALRHEHLVAAAAVLPGPKLFKRCEQLAAAAKAFSTSRWPRWKRLDAPPPGARPVDVHLWHALRLGGDLPVTAQAYYVAFTKQNAAAV